MDKQILEALEKVRPSLQADGGDVEFVSYDEKAGELQVKLKGMCYGCPMAQITLNEGILAEVRKAVPGVKKVIQV
jgi:Fe-S cluster biogenesis protein NfuA